MLEIFNAQPVQFSIAASGIQGGLHQQSEIGRAHCDYTLLLFDGEKTNADPANRSERFHPSPCRVGTSVTLCDRVIDGRCQNGKHPICARFSRPLFFLRLGGRFKSLFGPSSAPQPSPATKLDLHATAPVGRESVCPPR